MKVSEMNTRQKRAWELIRDAGNNIVGGYENSVTDGHLAAMPSAEDIENEIYDDVINGQPSLIPARDVRFLGAEWIRERIKKRVEKLLADL